VNRLLVSATFIILYCCNIKLHASSIVLSFSLSTTAANCWCTIPGLLPHSLHINHCTSFLSHEILSCQKPKTINNTHSCTSLCAGAHCDRLRVARGNGHRRQPPRRAESRRAQCTRPAGTPIRPLACPFMRSVCVVRQRDMRSKIINHGTNRDNQFHSFPHFSVTKALYS
jgi:hypothetical protein